MKVDWPDGIEAMNRDRPKYLAMLNKLKKEYERMLQDGSTQLLVRREGTDQVAVIPLELLRTTIEIWDRYMNPS